MNVHAKVEIGHSVCPHDCPSTCALDVELLRRRPDRPRARRRGQQLHGRRHLRQGRALRRARPSSRPADAPAAAQGRARARASSSASPGTTRSTSPPRPCWRPSAATARRRSGPTTMPAPWASCMRDGINRLRHAKRYSGMYATICTTLAWTGYIAGTGKLAGPDPREMAKSDLVVIWGTNPVNTQVNVMTHAIARPQGARRQDRRHRHLPQRHHGAGRPGAVPASPAPTARSPAPSCTCCSATATPTGRIWRSTPTARASSRRTWRPRTPEWASAITGLTRRRDRDLRQAWSAPRPRPTSGWATASPARATAPTTCTPRCASRPSPAPGCTRAAAASTTTAPSTTGTSR